MLWEPVSSISCSDLKNVRWLGAGGNSQVHEYMYEGAHVAVKSPCAGHEVAMHFRAGVLLVCSATK